MNNTATKQTAILLINLGSPDSPDIRDVRDYLNHFLMDPDVIDLPYIIRRPLVSMITHSRAANTSHAYHQVWTAEGSPLVATSLALEKTLHGMLPYPHRVAMRYGAPSIDDALDSLSKECTLKHLIVMPLYPHYARSTVGTAVKAVEKSLKKRKLIGTAISIVPPFYNDPVYIDALAEVTKPYLIEPYDHVVFSYHSLPVRHILKDDQTKVHCLKQADCCYRVTPAHEFCYKAHTVATTEHLADSLGIPRKRYSIAYQSKLGRADWLKPSTEEVLVALAKENKKRVCILCPSFVTDCLETIEEINIRAREVFVSHGGEELRVIPCLNVASSWVEAIKTLIERMEEESSGTKSR